MTTMFVSTTIGSLAVRVVGAGRPALLWHSLYADSTTWGRVEPTLAWHRRLVMIDGPAHGDSPAGTSTPSLSTCAAAACEVLDALGIADPVDWLGNAWGGYVGTTDTDYQGSVDDVRPEPADIRYLLDVANFTIPGAHLTERDVVGSWAGLRPLVAPPPGVSESNTSREHEISEGPSGMLTISGGKLTTSRVMARQLVDRVEKALGHRGRYRAGDVPLPGADPVQIREVRARADAAGVPAELVGRWVARYGANAAGVLDRYLESEANTEVIGARGLTRAELAYCVAEEMVVTLADLMIRRTSTFFWEADGGLSTVQAVADELERLVPWEPGRKQSEIDEYRCLVSRHRPTPPA